MVWQVMEDVQGNVAMGNWYVIAMFLIDGTEYADETGQGGALCPSTWLLDHR